MSPLRIGPRLHHRYAVKVSHSHAHSLTDLPPKTWIIDSYLKILLTQKVLLLQHFKGLCSVPFVLPLIGLRLHHRASKMQFFPGHMTVKIVAFRFIACSIFNKFAPTNNPPSPKISCLDPPLTMLVMIGKKCRLSIIFRNNMDTKLYYFLRYKKSVSKNRCI